MRLPKRKRYYSFSHTNNVQSSIGFFLFQKKFCKGLKQWSKNFFRIRKELLPHRTTVSEEFAEHFFASRVSTY